ncbi:MAG: DUF1345 domain-containing protein [Microbacterium sp.]|uniref:DUF1345 domain-containing protein n=1 Tax=Microbacterium sp. TaxID=51671 RepID=UPI0039E4E49C
MTGHRGLPPVIVRAPVALAAGLVAGAASVPLLGIAAGLLAGWAAFAGVNVAWILLALWPMDGAQTRAHARRDDPGRTTAGFVAVIGSLASLGAVLVVLVQTEDTPRWESFVLAAVAVVSVAASWLLIQVDYMLRLAAVYFADPEGGIDFHQDEDPTYTDFAYVSFGLGMTYQIADTDVRTNAIRRLVIAQTLLAYLFGAVILATVINLVTGL